MTNKTPHIIQKLVFELHSPSKKNSDEIASIFKEAYLKALPTIEKHLNSFNTDEVKTIKLDRLEIELGTLSIGETESRLVDIIINEINKQIPDKLDILKIKKELNLNSKEDYVEKSKEDKEKDVLVFFLKNGTLPWWASKEINQNKLEEIFDVWLNSAHSKTELLNISILLNDINICKRIAHMFSKKIGDKLIKILFDDKIKLVKEIESIATNAANNHNKKIILQKIQAKAIQLISTYSGVSNKDDTIANELIIEISSLTNTPYEQLINSYQVTTKKHISNNESVVFKEWGNSIQRIILELRNLLNKTTKTPVSEVDIKALNYLIKNLVIQICKLTNTPYKNLIDSIDYYLNSKDGKNKYFISSESLNAIRQIVLNIATLLKKIDNPNISENDIKLLNQLMKELLIQYSLLAEIPKINLVKPFEDATKKIFSLKKNKYLKETLDTQDNRKKESLDLLYDKQKTSTVNSETDLENIYVSNAGLVLLWGYLSPLFKNLNLIENGLFVTEECKHKAVCLLQYICFGEDTYYEYQLALNKVLCGMPTNETIISQENFITDYDRKEVDELLKSIIANWKIINNTSIQGFKLSFLQREGVLVKEKDNWKLYVERKAHDVLLESLPWGYKFIKNTWTDVPLLVEW